MEIIYCIQGCFFCRLLASINENWISIALCFIGIIGGIIGTVWIIYRQFEQSRAGMRVKLVRDATNEMIREYPAYAGYLSNKYRYSLGVIIDSFLQTFGGRGISKAENCYPNIVYVDKDRWQLFNERVRPVIDDINAYSFLGFLSILNDVKLLKQLKALTNLYNEIEATVAELDSLIQYQDNYKIRIVYTVDGRPGFQINSKVEYTEREIEAKMNNAIQVIFVKYGNLERAWNKWLEVTRN